MEQQAQYLQGKDRIVNNVVQFSLHRLPRKPGAASTIREIRQNGDIIGYWMPSGAGWVLADRTRHRVLRDQKPYRCHAAADLERLTADMVRLLPTEDDIIERQEADARTAAETARRAAGEARLDRIRSHGPQMLAAIRGILVEYPSLPPRLRYRLSTVADAAEGLTENSNATTCTASEADKE